MEDLTHKVNSQDDVIREMTIEVNDLKSKLTSKCNEGKISINKTVLLF